MGWVSLVDLGIDSLVAYASVKSPFEVIYEYPIRLPADLALGQESNKYAQ